MIELRPAIAGILIMFVSMLAPRSVHAQSIPWRSDYLLQWDDFQGPPDTTSKYAAETHWDYKYATSGDASGALKVKVDCSFSKVRSWKRPEKKLTPQILMHEQLHFYIAEIHARRMRQAFEGYAASHTFASAKSNELGDIFKKCNKECNDQQALYDKETAHSMVPEKQEEWHKKIVAQLQELKAYEVK